MKEQIKIALEAKKKIERENLEGVLQHAKTALSDLFELCNDSLDVALAIMPQLDVEFLKLKDNVTNKLIQKNFDAMFDEILNEENLRVCEEALDEVLAEMKK